MHLVCKFKASKVYIQYTYICVLPIYGSLTIINSVDCFLGRLTIIFCEVVAFRKAFCVCMSTHTKTVTICYLQGSGGNSCTCPQHSVLHVHSTASYMSTAQHSTAQHSTAQHSTARRMCGSPIRFLLSYKTKKKIGIVVDVRT